VKARSVTAPGRTSATHDDLQPSSSFSASTFAPQLQHNHHLRFALSRRMWRSGRGAEIATTCSLANNHSACLGGRAREQDRWMTAV